MAREVQKIATQEDKMECMLDCIYTVRNHGDLPWYEMSVHIRDKIMPFFKLLREMKLLTKGEYNLTNEQGNKLSYKGELYQGKAHGAGIMIGQ